VDIEFIGLGKMGPRHRGAGHRVRAWNKSPAEGDFPVNMEIVVMLEEALQGAAAISAVPSGSPVLRVREHGTQ
jgi:3-hydroxyisobutyrate dehydrogenase-like beta-hydroxyacid dehydrogenase